MSQQKAAQVIRGMTPCCLSRTGSTCDFPEQIERCACVKEMVTEVVFIPDRPALFLLFGWCGSFLQNTMSDKLNHMGNRFTSWPAVAVHQEALNMWTLPVL